MSDPRLQAPVLTPGEKVYGPPSYFLSIEKNYGQPIQHWIDIAAERLNAGSKHMEVVEQFKTEFGDDPGQTVALWLFTLVLGHSRYLWGEFVWHQDLMTVLRCHVAAFAALGGVPRQILYDRMKTAVLGEVADGIIYNAQLQALARHYGFTPRACAAYRAKTKGKVERPYRYVRQDFFLGRQFQNLEDLNAQGLSS